MENSNNCKSKNCNITSIINLLNQTCTPIPGVNPRVAPSNTNPGWAGGSELWRLEESVDIVRCSRVVGSRVDT